MPDGPNYPFEGYLQDVDAIMYEIGGQDYVLYPIFGKLFRKTPVDKLVMSCFSL